MKKTYIQHLFVLLSQSPPTSITVGMLSTSLAMCCSGAILRSLSSKFRVPKITAAFSSASLGRAHENLESAENGMHPEGWFVVVCIRNGQSPGYKSKASLLL